MPRAARCPACAYPPPLYRRIHTSNTSTPIRLKVKSNPRSSTRSDTFFTARFLLPHSRPFTHRSSLLLVSQPFPRPQLPFLHPSTFTRRPPTSTTTQALIRYLTTERRARWKLTAYKVLRVQLYFWPIFFLGLVLFAGVQQSIWEYRHPTPREYGFWTRWELRDAFHAEFDEEFKEFRVLTDWNVVGVNYLRTLRRLEDRKGDGRNLIASEELVEGVGRTGFDISAKSEQWRRGYYQALMGAGRAAENLDGMVKRKGVEWGELFPREYIPGPSNKRPVPMPWDKKGVYLNPPTEEEVEEAFPQPEVFYMKVLTTKGFNSGQRLDAALAYADWCDFKGLQETAGDMYYWALDIAAGGLLEGASGVVDMKTGVIQKGKEEMVTQNLLKATTALAVHHARKGEVKEALPIFLSVLRARKTLPAAPAYFEVEQKSEVKKRDSIWLPIRNFLFDSPYPPLPDSGDTRPFHTLKEACEEVGLMTYIGEILFATSASEREKGLSWTRDSVEAAEAVMWVMDETNEQEGREKCRDCLETGLKNWRDMAKEMQKLAAKNELDAEKSSGFLGTGWGKRDVVEKAKKDVERWKKEEEQIELRTQKTSPLLTTVQPTSGSWLGV